MKELKKKILFEIITILNWACFKIEHKEVTSYQNNISPPPLMLNECSKILFSKCISLSSEISREEVRLILRIQVEIKVRMSQYTGEAQPFEDFEAELLRMNEEKKLNETPTTSTPKKRQYRRKLNYSATTTPKKKQARTSKVQLTRAPKKAVSDIEIDSNIFYSSQNKSYSFEIVFSA